MRILVCWLVAYYNSVACKYCSLVCEFLFGLLLLFMVVYCLVVFIVGLFGFVCFVGVFVVLGCCLVELIWFTGVFGLWVTPVC